MSKTILSGGDLGGTEVDEWTLGETREFQTEDGRTLVYRSGPDAQAAFVKEL